MLALTFSEVVSTVAFNALYNQTLIQLKDIHYSQVVQLVQLYE